MARVGCGLLACLLAACCWPARASAAASGSPASAGAPAPLELIVLGSGGPGAQGRACASYAVLIDGVPRILLDAGSGAFARIGEAKVSLAALDIVLLTHLHADHAAELPGIIKARAVSSSGPIRFRVFGPGGSPGGGSGDAYFPSTSRFMQLMFGPRGAFAYLKDFAAPVAFEVHDITARGPPESAPRVVLSEHGFTVRAVIGHHGDAPAVIYRIDHGGRSVTFSGDIDAAGLPALRRIAQGSDLLVFNSVVLDPPGSPAVLYTLHTPPRAIGEVARDSHVRALLLSHLSPATDAGREEVLRSIARSFRGPVRFAEDRMQLSP